MDLDPCFAKLFEELSTTGDLCPESLELATQLDFTGICQKLIAEGYLRLLSNPVGEFKMNFYHQDGASISANSAARSMTVWAALGRADWVTRLLPHCRPLWALGLDGLKMAVRYHQPTIRELILKAFHEHCPADEVQVALRVVVAEAALIDNEALFREFLPRLEPSPLVGVQLLKELVTVPIYFVGVLAHFEGGLTQLELLRMLKTIIKITSFGPDSHSDFYRAMCCYLAKGFLSNRNFALWLKEPTRLKAFLQYQQATLTAEYFDILLNGVLRKWLRARDSHRAPTTELLRSVWQFYPGDLVMEQLVLTVALTHDLTDIVQHFLTNYPDLSFEGLLNRGSSMTANGSSVLVLAAARSLRGRLEGLYRLAVLFGLGIETSVGPMQLALLLEMAGPGARLSMLSWVTHLASYHDDLVNENLFSLYRQGFLVAEFLQHLTTAARIANRSDVLVSIGYGPLPAAGIDLCTRGLMHLVAYQDLETLQRILNFTLSRGRLGQILLSKAVLYGRTEVVSYLRTLVPATALAVDFLTHQRQVASRLGYDEMVAILDCPREIERSVSIVSLLQ